MIQDIQILYIILTPIRFEIFEICRKPLSEIIDVIPTSEYGQQICDILAEGFLARIPQALVRDLSVKRLDRAQN